MRWIAGEHGASLAGGDLFVGIKTEDGEIAEAASTAPAKARADGLGCVFDEGQLMASREISKRIHLGRDAEGVNYKDGTSAGRDRALDGGGVEIERGGIDLNQNRRSAHLKYGVDDGHEGKRGKDDLIALAHPKREQREMETCRAGTHGHRMIYTVIGGQLRFKGGELRTQAEVRRAQNRVDCRDLCFSDVGRGEWNARRSSSFRLRTVRQMRQRRRLLDQQPVERNGRKH